MFTTAPMLILTPTTDVFDGIRDGVEDAREDHALRGVLTQAPQIAWQGRGFASNGPHQDEYLANYLRAYGVVYMQLHEAEVKKSG